MKLNILKLLLIFTVLASYTQASFIGDLKRKKQDIENYMKVTKIQREISYNKKRRVLDVYYDKGEKVTELKPVLIWIYGGAWTQGDRVKYNKLGSLVYEEGFIAVLPNYVLFPFGSIEDMVYDVYTAIQWTYENISRYGGDPNRIYLSGHSAGGHLISLAILKSYLGHKINGEVLPPLPHIEKVVLLSAPYDFDDLGLLLKVVSIEENADNTIIEKIGKVIFGTEEISPYDLVRDLPDNSVTDSFNVDKFVFYYPDKDEVIPERSVKKYMKQLQRVCKDINIQFVYTEKGYKHSTITIGIRGDEKEQSDLYLELLKL